MNLFIFKYNNYYNRILKKENTLEEYGDVIYSCEPQSFNSNDGINTELLLGDIYNPYSGEGDYLIVTDEDDNILSRWFILEVRFETARNQWRVTLRRDLLVDYYDYYINTDCFIEKATLSSDDPLVFNEENMTFNQIKTSETLLKDETGCAWIVGYYSKKAPGDGEAYSGTVESNSLSSLPIKTLPTSIETWYQGPFNGPATSGEYVADVLSETQGTRRLFATNILTGDTYYKGLADYYNGGLKYYSTKSEEGVAADLQDEFKATSQIRAKEYLDTLLAHETQNDIDNFLSNYPVGTLVKDPISHKVYQIRNIKAISKNNQKVYIPTGGSLFEYLKNVYLGTTGFSGTPAANTFYALINYVQYSVEYFERTDLTVTYNLIGETTLLTEDAPYNIFAIPYGQVDILNADGTLLVKTDEDLALATARAIQVNGGSSIYDIQILPYFPLQELIENGKIRITDSAQYTSILQGSSTVKGVIFNVPKSKFTLNILHSIETPQTTIEKKISNQCDRYRLCSPNFNGYFDFSSAKNNGVQYFNVDCYYKPFQPYIHVNPYFSGLYGQDFDDPRGLICGGDFSISSISDAWEQYQIQNKNFQEIFDREKKNMDIQHQYQRTSGIINAVVGAAGGVTSGAIIGSMAGPVGTAIGAIAGGISSAGAGVTDVLLSESLRTEAMNYKQDMFDYQLGNIQALPYSLTKVTSLNNNNKIFPLLEYYTCTDREKDAFAKKLAYNGMTVMVIDKPSKYINNNWTRTMSDDTVLEQKGYIKGSIIRIENLNDEFHLLKSISDEFYKGVYIK